MVQLKKQIHIQFTHVMKHSYYLILLVLLILISINCVDLAKSKTVLDADAQNYVLFAKSMSFLFDTQMREPVWIWLVRLFMTIFSDPDRAVKCLGIVLFILTNVVLFLLVSKIFRSPWSGILAVIFFGLNPYLQDLAARGLRDNAFNLLTLTTSLILYTLNARRPLWWTLLILTVATFSLMGVRINSFLPLLIVYPISFYRSGIPVKWSFVPIVLSLIFITPYFLYCKEKFQDPLYSANHHAKWWRNHEFVRIKNVPCTGCPTLKEMQERGGYEGGPVTTFEYVFKMRPLKDLISNTISGYLYMFLPPYKWLFKIFHMKPNSNVFNRTLSSTYFPVHWFYFLGLFSLFFFDFYLIFLLPIAILNLIPFTVSLGMDERIFTFVSPYMSIVAVLGVLVLLNFIKKIYRIRGTRRAVLC